MRATTCACPIRYDGMMAGDEAKLARAFHPRACIVGNEQGELHWAALEEFVAECSAASTPGVWYSDDLSLVRIDGAWRIVHKTFYPHPAS